jgi:soluble lytic murein transglycosylase-like protein
LIRRLLLIVCLLAMAPAVAHAQIYAWRDAGGNLVLSDKPKDPSAKTYAVATTTARSTIGPSAAFTGKADGFRTTTALSKRATLYDDAIADHASRNALNPAFVKAVIQAESGFTPRAVSPKGAMGLMQLMPQTAAQYGVLDAFNPMENIRAGVAYLKSLLVRYDQNESLALAAYNAGPGAVEKFGRSVPPYRETRDYVAKIRAASSTGAARPVTHVFKTVEIVDGREIVRYSNKPAAGAEVVKGTDR